ncbi:MAG TPA: SDR family NAD(P)-dependent oxidoreductase [Steroidobacteraceae bacterium]|nr:SDR family NAD(P)-dependent oxidoreductase [Steroidobacteraceae bacterium]
MNDGADSVVWVAGVGASAGLGAALARRFAQGGMLAAITGRSAARVQAVSAEIGLAGGRAVALPGDIALPEDVERLAVAVKSLGHLRAAIFNAGHSVWGSLLEITPQQFEEAWRTSTYGGFLFARAVLPALLEAGGGSLLFSGATASIRGRGPFVAFAAAKAGLRSLAQSTAREFGPRGVHVAHVIIDGGIDGERLRSNASARVAAAGQDGLLHPDAIAESYWQLHQQHRSAWTHELDLRPYKEAF